MAVQDLLLYIRKFGFKVYAFLARSSKLWKLWHHHTEPRDYRQSFSSLTQRSSAYLHYHPLKYTSNIVYTFFSDISLVLHEEMDGNRTYEYDYTEQGSRSLVIH